MYTSLSRSRALVLPLVLLMSLGVSLVSPVSAAVPIAPPSTSGAPLGGWFSAYFSNMSTACPLSQFITGFSTAPGPSYMTPTCTPIGPIISGVLAGDINSLINTYLRINVANITGSVLSGFDGSGNPVYTTMSSSQWIDGLIPNSITYTSGNVGIGTMAPTAMLDVVGNVAVSGNVTSANPTLPNHLTTMNYVDTQIRGICVSLGGSYNAGTKVCTPAPAVITYSWQSGTPGACSVSCGGGTLTVSVVCKKNDGSIAPDSSCTGTKPANTILTCNVAACASSSVCGNSIIETGESCDDGAANGQVGRCNTSCNGVVPPPPPVQCPAGNAFNYPSPNGSNSCSYSWGSASVGASLSASVTTGTPVGSISGNCRSDGTWNYVANCPNTTGVTCPAGSQNVVSPDSSNTCTMSWGWASQGSPLIGTATRGGTISGTCEPVTGWNFGFNCPNLASPSCPGGSQTVTPPPPSTRTCRFNWPMTNVGNSVSILDVDGYGGVLDATCTPSGGATWNITRLSCDGWTR